MTAHRRCSTGPSPLRARCGFLGALLALAALALPAVTAAATPWWNADWHYRKALSVRLPQSPTGGTTSSIVVPVRLHAGNFQYLQDLQPSGADLRFVSSDGTPLKHQLELIDAVAGVLIAWVEVPIKPGLTEQSIWMYYGNPRATAPDDPAVYDRDQLFVLHFGDKQGLPRDATANHFDATASTAELGATGVIGSGARFDGHSLLRIAARPALALTENGGFTFSGWVKPDAAEAQGVLYSQSQGGAHLEIGVAAGKVYAEIRDGARTNRVESIAPLAGGEWQQVTVSIGTDITIYINGSPAGAAPSGGLPGLSGDVLIGGLDAAGGAGGLSATLDEVGVAKTPRSAWWAQATTLAQSAQSTLVAYGTDESKGSAGKFAAYFAMMGNLLSQVSLDGLIVITITALMGLASLQVLISKAGLLRRVEREDARFLGEFSQRFRHDVGNALLGEPAGAAGPEPGNEGEYADSGLFSMYRAGLSSLDDVLAVGGTARSRRSLTSEAFEAIRAGLDAALVEANNRLNDRLVVMTVAIAGAPFLGLLGTVVGVMITFASIAAAGDVNVNTIAPGVAAAMAATVVGLLVAIPSLFGYNWLAVRIGRRASAMEVFADRFVASLGLIALGATARPGPAELAGRSQHAA